MSRVLLPAASALVTLLVFVGCAQSIIFRVPADHGVCFGEELGYDMVVHATYKALDDKLGTLKVVVSRATDPVQDPSLAAPKPIVGKDGNTGSFGFTTEAQGEYRFCFTLTQPAHPQSEVEVDFDLKVGYETKDYAEVARKEHLKPVEIEVVKLNDEANELLNELRFIRTREAEHRDTTENTNSAVVGWSVASLIVIVAMGAYQTLYLRNFFRKKRLIN